MFVFSLAKQVAKSAGTTTAAASTVLCRGWPGFSTRASFLSRHLSTTTTPPAPSTPPPRSLGDAAVDIFKRVAGLYMRYKITAGLVTIVGGGTLVYQVSERKQLNDMVAAFERGGNQLAVFDSTDAKATVPRDDVLARINRVLHPTDDSRFYGVITGESGTGKSTAVRKAIREYNGTSGSWWGGSAIKDAVYVMVRDPQVEERQAVVKRYLHAIEEATGCNNVVLSVWRTLLVKFGFIDRPRTGPSSYDELMDWLLKAAKAYQRKHGRPVALVLDAADRVAKDDAAFLAKLQSFAKDCADLTGGPLVIVFVSSEGSVLPVLQSHSAWTRARKPPLEIGDINDNDAIEYLIKFKNVPKTDAVDAVKTITGGRFALLNEYSDYRSAGYTNDAIRDVYYETTDKTLEGLGIDPTSELFRTLVVNKTVKTGAALKIQGMSKDKLEALLKANILSVHPDATYTFHSRYVETFVASQVAKTPATQK